MILNKHYECMERAEIEQFQFEKLQSTLNRLVIQVPFYRELFEKTGLAPSDITSLNDIKRIPFTNKETLRKNYPYGLFAVPLREVVRIHTSSGTTGMPIVIGYTRNDINHWTELVARVLVAGGMTKDDVIQVAYNYGLFTGGLGFHYGAEMVGASVIPSSSHNPEGQLHIMKHYKTTVLVCTPSYALTLAETLVELGIKPQELSLRFGIFGAEPWSEKVRERIEQTFKITAYDTYGISEIMGPGVASECEAREGLHLFEDHFIPEIVNPETGELVREGEEGELIITTITKEAMPLLRFRTGDITSLNYEPCKCGRTIVRMSRVKNRTDDTIFFQGSKVQPAQIEEILTKIEGLLPHHQIVLDTNDEGDTFTVKVELDERLFSDEIRKIQEIQSTVERQIEKEIGITSKVVFVEPRSLERTIGKTKHVIDNRKK
jgi:phenylacetate-CoA ligase